MKRLKKDIQIDEQLLQQYIPHISYLDILFLFPVIPFSIYNIVNIVSSFYMAIYNYIHMHTLLSTNIPIQWIHTHKAMYGLKIYFNLNKPFDFELNRKTYIFIMAKATEWSKKKLPTHNWIGGNLLKETSFKCHYMFCLFRYYFSFDYIVLFTIYE